MTEVHNNGVLHTDLPEHSGRERLAISRRLVGAHVKVRSVVARPEDPESMRANEYFEKYLDYNSAAADDIEDMTGTIEEYKRRSPVVVTWRCSDGREHGPKGLGMPTTVAHTIRTEGCKGDLSPSNTDLWDTINAAIAEAQDRTQGTPAMMLILGHDDPAGHEHHLGCAAHGYDGQKALELARNQAAAVRQRKGADLIYVIYGISNTADRSKTLYFENGTETPTKLSSAELIEQLRRTGLTITEPAHLFTQAFLNNNIDDPSTNEDVGNRTPLKLLTGDEAPIYQERRVAFAMETYLLRRVSERRRSPDMHTDSVVREEVFKAVEAVLDGIPNLPEGLKGKLIYQTVWNMAYALYQRNRLQGMREDEIMQHRDHDEELICMGKGFETLPRNRAFLIKFGRGDYQTSLTTLLGVLLKLKNRTTRLQGLPPLIHINFEADGEAFSIIESRLMTMLDVVHEVMRDERFAGLPVRILTTYSRKHEKRFYPVQVSSSSPNECYPGSVVDGMRHTRIDEDLPAAEDLYRLQRKRRISRLGNGHKPPVHA